MNLQPRQSPFATRANNVSQSFIREILKVASNPEIISFAGGLPNPEFFPVKDLESCAASVFQKYGIRALQYADTEGYLPLRSFIAERYRERYNLKISPEQILITTGSQQALDIIGKLFINPGDNVMIERPSYLGAIQCFSMFEPQFVEIELGKDGLNAEELESKLEGNANKLIYTIPNFQNPTGRSYSYNNRKIITDILSKHSTLIVEDDPYGEIAFTDRVTPPLYSFLPEQTILLGSFSKIIAPGLRVGWMVANADIIRKATVMKQASDLHTSNLSQYILHEYLQNYDLKSHIEKINIGYQSQRDIMMECLADYFQGTVSYTKPEGGLFAWLTLPQHISSRVLLDRALKKKIIFVPGDPFYVSKKDTQTLRLNFSNVEGDVMKEALYTLAKLISA